MELLHVSSFTEEEAAGLAFRAAQSAFWKCCSECGPRCNLGAFDAYILRRHPNLLLLPVSSDILQRSPQHVPGLLTSHSILMCRNFRSTGATRSSALELMVRLLVLRSLCVSRIYVSFEMRCSNKATSQHVLRRWSPKISRCMQCASRSWIRGA